MSNKIDEIEKGKMNVLPFVFIILFIGIAALIFIKVIPYLREQNVIRKEEPKEFDIYEDSVTTDSYGSSADELQENTTEDLSTSAEIEHDAILTGYDADSDDNDTNANKGEMSSLNLNGGSISTMDSQDGEPPYLSDGFEETFIRIWDGEIRAWQWNEMFYVFYAQSPSGNEGWFLYDTNEGRWVRYMDFLIENDYEFMLDDGYFEDEPSSVTSLLGIEPPKDSSGQYQKPEFIPVGFKETEIKIGGDIIPAWNKDDFYIFYAKSPSGRVGWFLYDSYEGRWVRYLFKV